MERGFVSSSNPLFGSTSADGGRRRCVCYHPLVAQVADEAAAAVIRDLAGGEHRLDELWVERPVVLVFLRHFG